MPTIKYSLPFFWVVRLQATRKTAVPSRMARTSPVLVPTVPFSGIWWSDDLKHVAFILSFYEVLHLFLCQVTLNEQMEHGVRENRRDSC